MFTIANRVIGTAVLTGAMFATAATGWAQDAGRGRVPCPEPYLQTLSAGPGPISGQKSDLPPSFLSYAGKTATSFGQSGQDTIFYHTLRWDVRKDLCCDIQGQIKVTLKSQSSGINNDSVGLSVGGNAVVPQQALNSANAGEIKTVTFTLPASVIANGYVTVWAQDDHSIENIRMELRGCCVRPMRKEH